MNYPHLTSLSAMLLAASMISACGDDGDSLSDGLQDRLGSVNTAPEASDQSLGTDENTALEITLSGNDADGDALTFTVTAQPGNGALSGTAPNLTYTPDTDYIGSDSFTFTVNDGSENSAEATVNIAVNQFYFSIGGTVTNNLTPVTLENNGGEAQEVAGVSFEFPTKQTDGSDYAVTVADHPEQQLCSVDAATGTVDGADVDLDVLCRYWRTAQEINDSLDEAGHAQIAVDSEGNAIAVWRQYDLDDSEYNAYANSYTPDGGWGTAVLLEETADTPHYPQIVFDSAGNAIAVWFQRDGTRTNIWANRYTPDTGWVASAAEKIENDDTGGASNVQIAVDSSGNAIAVWEQYDGVQYSIYANRYTPDTGWDANTAELIENVDTGGASVPQIAIDSAGNAIAVWDQYDGTQYSIYANRYTPDSGWDASAAAAIGSHAGNAFLSQIAIDSDGNAVAVWIQQDGRQAIRANTYTPGSGWGAASEVIDNGAGNNNDPQIAMDSAGNAIAVWGSDDGTQERIQVNYYSADSGSWGTVEPAGTGADSIDGPQIAIDSVGNAIAVWQQGDVSEDSIYASLYSPGDGWDTEELIETGDDSAGEPHIAVGSAGNAIAVWPVNAGSNPSIQVNHFE